MPEYSDFIVYADESGDHGLARIDPQYPVFALTFCVVRKDAYISEIVPAMQRFKFDIWGHDSVVLHEHDLRKTTGPFGLLRTDRALRDRFYEELNHLMVSAPMAIFASVIDKLLHREKYENPWNPYEIALHFCMERLHGMMTIEGQAGKTVHIVFESRGLKEDKELELEFRRIASNDSHWGNRRKDFSQFDFQPVFVSKGGERRRPAVGRLNCTAYCIVIFTAKSAKPGVRNNSHQVTWAKVFSLRVLDT